MAAGFTLAVVDLELLFEVAWLAILPEEVAQGCAALFDGFVEYSFDFCSEPDKPLLGNVASFACWPYTTVEEGLAGVDITNPDHDFVVHNVLLDGCFSVLASGCQIIGIEIIFQRLRAQVTQEWVRIYGAIRVIMPEHGAKTSWIVKPHFHASIDAQNEMIVFLEVQFMGADAQAARHAKMENQGSNITSDQKVFGTPLHALNRVAGDVDYGILDGPTHAGLPDLDMLNLVPQQIRLNPASGGFNFW